MIKAVLDTNILLSSLFWKGQPRKIVDLAIENKFRAVTSADILEELKCVLEEDFSQVPYDARERILRDILSYSALVIPKKITVKNLRDFQDTKIIACAFEAEAEYIVTGDKDLLVLKEYARIKITTAREFLEALKH